MPPSATAMGKITALYFLATSQTTLPALVRLESLIAAVNYW